jgi:dienelactone hydrolase
MCIEALVDEKVHLDIPEETFLEATLIDDYGNHWESQGCSGQEMDWLVNMKPKGIQSIYIKKSIDPTLISLKFFRKDKILSEKTVKQHYLGRGVTYEKRGEGRVYHPQTKLSKTGVIVFNGSGGGRADTRAALLASRGFTAYALPYFRFGNLPSRLERIPLEYFETEIEWFRKQVDSLALMGNSKGGEFSLVLGTLLDIDKIVAYVPSCATYGGFPNFHLPAWTYRGKDFPIAPVFPDEKITMPIVATPFFLKGFDQLQESLIPVEKIKCPLLIISGDDDQMWPSNQFGDRIVEKCPHAVHLCYKGAGHIIGPPYIPLSMTESISPVDGNRYEMGGQIGPHLKACEDSWKKVLQFLS